MKYKIKYLIEYESFVYADNLVFNNIDNYEVNKNSEIEIDNIEICKDYIDFICINYCIVMRNKKLYWAVSEDDLIKYSQVKNSLYLSNLSENKIKLIKDIIIKEIIE